MKGYAIQVEKVTRKNADFRRVLYTGKHCQLVLMSLKPLEEIGAETHEDRDQFFRFERGEGKVVIDGVEHRVKDGDGIIVPAGARHNVITLLSEQALHYTRFTPHLNTRMVWFVTRKGKRWQVRSISTGEPQSSRT